MRKIVVGLLLALACATPIVAGDNFVMKRAPRDVYDARMADWRNRQVVYQVFVDRFATSGDPKRKS